jgi:hypothetical protein
MKTTLQTKTDWLDAEVKVTYTEMTEGGLNEDIASIRVDKMEILIGDDYLDITNQAKESFYKMLK